MATISSTLSLQDRMSKPLGAIDKAMGGTLKTMQAVEGAEFGDMFQRAAGDIHLAEQALGGLEKGLDDMGNGARRGADGFTVMKGLAVNAIAAIGSAIKNAIGDAITLSDTLSGQAARFKLIADEGESVAEMQEKIFAAAERSRGSYLEMADAVSKMKLLAGDAFSSTEQAVAFTELLNKQFAIAGAGASETAAATRQITQALASGRLQGDEFVSVLENAPLFAQAIADYAGKSIGELKELSSEGLLTADILKNAMFSAAAETNAAFEAMPLTWGQLWTTAQNNILQTFQPFLEVLASGAQFVADNWNLIAPVLAGLAAGVAAVTIALGIYTVGQWIATGAAAAFFSTLLTNPLTWVLALIGAVVGLIAAWVQSVGGLEIAWLMAQNTMLLVWGILQIGFLTAVTAILNLGDKMRLGLAKAWVGVQNGVGNMKVAVLTIIQNMVNGAIDLINKFIGVLNSIPGVSIEAISHVTFAAAAQAEEAAAQQARASDLADMESDIANSAADRQSALDQLKTDVVADAAARQAEIDAKKLELDKVSGNDDIYQEVEGIGDKLDGVTKGGGGGGGGGALKTTSDDPLLKDEDIKLLHDIATIEYPIIYQTIEPQLIMRDTTIRETADSEQILEEFAAFIEEYADSRLV